MKAEIFKSDSYEKILKHVIKFRHPELSFKEGLKEEAEYYNCILLIKNEMELVLTLEEYIHILTCAKTQEYEQRKNDKISAFGRPITISELCDAIDCEYFAKASSDNKKVYIRKPIEGIFCEIYIEERTYYLHEQSQDVIDKIARLFD